MTLIRAFLSVSSLTLLSRVMGLVRDVVIAAVFGAGPALDAFLAAFRLPNTLRRFTAEGALTHAAVPVYKQERQNSAESAAVFAGEITCLLVAFLSVLVLAAVLAAPTVIALFAPGLTNPQTAATLLQIVFPYIIFISVVAMFALILNATGRFMAAAAAPTILNVCLIAAALWWSDFFTEPVTALAWGVFGGGLLQMLFVGFFVRRANLWPRLRPIFPPTKQARRTMRLMWQGTLGAGATQINLLINLVIASLLPAGSISWLHYADRLMELPAGLLGATLATVALPALAGAAPAVRHAIIDDALRLALILAAPAAVGLAMLAMPMVEVLFMRGAFLPHDAEMTARAVLAYSIGVIGLVLLRPLAAAFFAHQDTATPAKTALLMLLCTQMLNVVFVFILDWGHAGLALSVGLGACANAAALWWILRRRAWYIPTEGWASFIFAVGAALVVMAALLAVAQTVDWHILPLWPGVTLLLIIALAAAVYFAALSIGGVKVSHFRRVLPLSDDKIPSARD